MIQGVQEKCVFSLSTATQQLTPIGWPILPISVKPIAARCLREREGAKVLQIIGKKNTIFNEHPVGIGDR